MTALQTDLVFVNCVTGPIVQTCLPSDSGPRCCVVRTRDCDEEDGGSLPEEAWLSNACESFGQTAVAGAPDLPRLLGREGSLRGRVPTDREYLELVHLNPIIDKLPDELTSAERMAVIDLLYEYADIFSKHEFDLGRTDMLEARIETGDSRPVCDPVRRQPRAYLGLIDEYTQKLHQAGVLEPSQGGWHSNLVIVKKKDGRPRVCIDLRKVNDVTERDAYPLPLISSILDNLSGSVWYSSIDVSNSFFQVPIAEEHRDKLSFSTRQGLWRWTALPMGAKNSSGVFSRLMALVLRGLSSLVVLSFVDDCVILGRTAEEHIANLRAVFERFRLAKMKLRPSKACIFFKRIRFLGFYVSQNGVEVDEDKVESIRQFEFPQSKTALRQWMGLSGYYRGHVQGYASIAAPLIEMLARDMAVVETPERRQSFEDMKRALTHAPVLKLPTDSGMYRLSCDASLTGAGAILEQWQDGKYRVIEYASRNFDKQERSFCITRRELAAVVFGLKQFKAYLLGNHFELYTDHSALLYYKKTAEPVGQQARYLDFIEEFDFEITHKPGESPAMRGPDALSRTRPCELEGGEPCTKCRKRIVGHDDQMARVCVVRTRAKAKEAEEQEFLDNLSKPLEDVQDLGDPSAGFSHDERLELAEQGVPITRNLRRVKSAVPRTAKVVVESQWTKEELVRLQREDADIKPAVLWCTEGHRPDWHEMAAASPFTRALWRQFESLILIDGIVHRIFHDTRGNSVHNQVVLPYVLKTPLLSLVHADVAGHLKLEKCVSHVIRRAWWLSWRSDLDTFIKCCKKCSIHHRGATPKQALLKPMSTGMPGQCIQIDLCGPYCSSNGFKYLFTAQDTFTRFTIAVPIANKEAGTVARCLVDHVFLQWGMCTSISSDLGGEFQNSLMDELYRLLDVHRIRSTSWRPQTDGKIERWHRTMHTMFAKVVSETQKDWSQYVKYITFCYNATVHRATQYTPFFLHTGREPLWRLDVLLDNQVVSQNTECEYAREVSDKLILTYRLVREHLEKANESASSWYNKRVKQQQFGVDEEVYVYAPQRRPNCTPKWQSLYKEEACVVRRLNETLYCVRSKKTGKERLVHVDKLKRIQHWEP